MLSRIREKSAKNPLLEPRKKIDRRVVENSNSAKHQKSRFLSALSRVHGETKFRRTMRNERNDDDDGAGGAVRKKKLNKINGI